MAQSAAAEQFLINGLCGRIRNNPAEKLHLIEKLLAGETNCLGGSQLKLSRGKYLLSAVKIFAARTIIESQDRGGSSEFLRGHGLDRTAADPEPRFSSASSENQNPSSSLCSLFTDLQFRKNQRTLLSRKLPARPRNIFSVPPPSDQILTNKMLSSTLLKIDVILHARICDTKIHKLVLYKYAKIKFEPHH